MEFEEVKSKQALRPFSKGLVNELSPIHLKDENCSDCRNIRLQGISTIPALGYDQFGDEQTGGTNIKGLAYYQELDGTDNYIMNYNARLYRYNSTTDAWDSIASSVTPITTDTEMNFLQAGDSLLCMNGVDELGKLDGTTYTEPSEATIKPKFADYFAGYMFAAGVSGKEDVIYYGRPNSDPINFPEYFYTIGGTANGAGARGLEAKIRWMKAMTNTLFVATSNAIWTLGRYDFTEFSSGIFTPVFKTLQRGVGGVGDNGRCVAADDKGSLYYLTPDKQVIRIAYIDTGEPTPIVISDDIRPLMERLDDDQSSSFMVFYPVTRLIKLWAKTDGATFNDIVLVYDVEKKTWLTDYDQPFNSGIFGGGKLLHGSDFTGKIFQGENGSAFDGDSPINTLRRTKAWTGSGAAREDTWNYVRLKGEFGNTTTTLTVRIIVDTETVKEESFDGSNLDFGGSTAFGEGDSFGGGEAFGDSIEAEQPVYFEKIFYLNDIGKILEVEIETNQTAAEYKLHELEYGWLPMGQMYDNINNIL